MSTRHPISGVSHRLIGKRTPGMTQEPKPESTAEREGIVDQLDAVLERIDRLEDDDAAADDEVDVDPRRAKHEPADL
jgi:hypothetical protein